MLTMALKVRPGRPLCTSREMPYIAPCPAARPRPSAVARRRTGRRRFGARAGPHRRPVHLVCRPWRWRRPPINVAATAQAAPFCDLHVPELTKSGSALSCPSERRRRTLTRRRRIRARRPASCASLWSRDHGRPDGRGSSGFTLFPTSHRTRVARRSTTNRCCRTRPAARTVHQPLGPRTRVLVAVDRPAFIGAAVQVAAPHHGPDRAAVSTTAGARPRPDRDRPAGVSGLRQRSPALCRYTSRSHASRFAPQIRRPFCSLTPPDSPDSPQGATGLRQHG